MLNGWQRIGVLATACWIAGIMAVASVERWGNPATVFSPNYVFKFVEFEPAAEQCLKKLNPATGKPEGLTEVIIGLSPQLVLPTTIVPPVLGWLFAYLVVWAVQWVKRGFTRE